MRHVLMLALLSFILCGCVSFSCVLDVEKDKTGWMVQESRCDIVEAP